MIARSKLRPSRPNAVARPEAAEREILPPSLAALLAFRSTAPRVIDGGQRGLLVAAAERVREPVDYRVQLRALSYDLRAVGRAAGPRWEGHVSLPLPVESDAGACQVGLEIGRVRVALEEHLHMA
jgi:hypothetical protein